MPTLFFLPRELDSPDRLDRCLEMGWRTSGQGIYNCNFLFLDDGTLAAVIPCRLPLKGYTFSKRARKLLRRNQQFTIAIGPATDGEAEQELQAAYYKWRPSIDKVMLSYLFYSFLHQKRVLDTQQLSVFLDDRLVAFSYFDLGQKAAYGKAAFYDPALAHKSLGLFTMLLEVAYCQGNGFDYYYPGYVSDDTPLFDYKHRIGPLEFYDIFSKQWLPYGQYPDLQKPLDVLLGKLELLANCLPVEPHPPKLYVYTNFKERYGFQGHSRLLDTPLFIYLDQLDETLHRIAYYNIDSNTYDLVLVTSSERRTNGRSWRHLPCYTSLLVIQYRLFSGADVAEFQQFLGL